MLGHCVRAAILVVMVMFVDRSQAKILGPNGTFVFSNKQQTHSCPPGVYLTIPNGAYHELVTYDKAKYLCESSGYYIAVKEINLCVSDFYGALARSDAYLDTNHGAWVARGLTAMPNSGLRYLNSHGDEARTVCMHFYSADNQCKELAGFHLTLAQAPSTQRQVADSYSRLFSPGVCQQHGFGAVQPRLTQLACVTQFLATFRNVMRTFNSIERTVLSSTGEPLERVVCVDMTYSNPATCPRGTVLTTPTGVALGYGTDSKAAAQDMCQSKPVTGWLYSNIDKSLEPCVKSYLQALGSYVQSDKFVTPGAILPYELNVWMKYDSTVHSVTPGTPLQVICQQAGPPLLVQRLQDVPHSTPQHWLFAHVDRTLQHLSAAQSLAYCRQYHQSTAVRLLNSQLTEDHSALSDMVLQDNSFGLSADELLSYPLCVAECEYAGHLPVYDDGSYGCKGYLPNKPGPAVCINSKWKTACSSTTAADEFLKAQPNTDTYNRNHNFVYRKSRTPYWLSIHLNPDGTGPELFRSASEALDFCKRMHGTEAQVSLPNYAPSGRRRRDLQSQWSPDMGDLIGHLRHSRFYIDWFRGDGYGFWDDLGHIKNWDLRPANPSAAYAFCITKCNQTTAYTPANSGLESVQDDGSYSCKPGYEKLDTRPAICGGDSWIVKCRAIRPPLASRLFMRKFGDNTPDTLMIYFREDGTVPFFRTRQDAANYCNGKLGIESSVSLPDFSSGPQGPLLLSLLQFDLLSRILQPPVGFWDINGGIIVPAPQRQLYGLRLPSPSHPVAYAFCVSHCNGLSDNLKAVHIDGSYECRPGYHAASDRALCISGKWVGDCRRCSLEVPKGVDYILNNGYYECLDSRKKRNNYPAQCVNGQWRADCI